MMTSIGLGVGGIFVAVALIYLLAYYNLFDAAELESQGLRDSIVATLVPLAIVFAGVVSFQTLKIV